MLSEELNIIKFKREMEQMINKNALSLKRLNEILSALNLLNINMQLLQKTKIGVCVNNVRKTFKSNLQIAACTASLIKKWKKIVKEEYNHSGSCEKKNDDDAPNAGSATPPSNDETSSTASTVKTDEASILASSSSAVGDVKQSPPAASQRQYSASGDDGKADIECIYIEDLDFDHPDFFNARHERSASSTTVDETPATKKRRTSSPQNSTIPKNLEDLRRKSIELLVETLKFEPDQRHADEMAMEIEQIVWDDCYSSSDPTHKAYKAKMRSRIMNLRDKNNPDLLKNVVVGALSPKTFARMSVEEMASDRLKKWRESVEQETIQERQVLDPTQSLAKSQMFACPKCSERDACYTISQDRVEGEYEPVCVTSLFCNKCGHSWKVY